MDRRCLGCTEMSHWDIIASPDAIPAERCAAEEFQRLFRQATGIQLPIRYYAPEKAHHVFVGPSAALDASDLLLDTAGMGEEEFRTIVETARIAIAGGRPRGTLYGVYQFLEDALGVRYKVERKLGRRRRGMG
jgi:alpha-glucuronidase